MRAIHRHKVSPPNLCRPCKCWTNQLGEVGACCWKASFTVFSTWIYGQEFEEKDLVGGYVEVFYRVLFSLNVFEDDTL